MKQLEILERKDIKELVKKEVESRTKYLERLINMLNNKIADISQIDTGKRRYKK